MAKTRSKTTSQQDKDLKMLEKHRRLGLEFFHRLDGYSRKHVLSAAKKQGIDPRRWRSLSDQIRIVEDLSKKLVVSHFREQKKKERETQAAQKLADGSEMATQQAGGVGLASQQGYSVQEAPEEEEEEEINLIQPKTIKVSGKYFGEFFKRLCQEEPGYQGIGAKKPRIDQSPSDGTGSGEGQQIVSAISGSLAPCGTGPLMAMPLTAMHNPARLNHGEVMAQVAAETELLKAKCSLLKGAGEIVDKYTVYTSDALKQGSRMAEIMINHFPQIQL